MDHYINSDPLLPPLTLVFDTDDVFFAGWERQTVQYSSVIEYNEHGRSDREVAAQGESPGTSVTLDFGNTIQGGTLTVTARLFLYKEDNGSEFGAKDLVSIINIKGRNPTKASIRERLATVQLQVIAYKESRFRQFGNDGMPLFGPPRGFGVMQIDTPPATARQIWDWHANVDAGVTLMAEKRQIAQSYLDHIRSEHQEAPAWTAEQWSLELYCLYNGGHYWLWDQESRAWSINVPNTAARTYAEDAKRIEDLVNSGTPPTDWD